MSAIQGCKKCTKCSQDKPFPDGFNKDASHKDGFSSVCRDCRKTAKKIAWSVRKQVLSPEELADDNKKRVLATKRYLKRHPEILKAAKKRYQKRHPEAQIRNCNRHREKYPEKVKARAKAQSAIASGRIKKLPCEVCGEIKVEAHHDDYSKPLDVRFLCPTHHKEFHNLYPTPPLHGTL